MSTFFAACRDRIPPKPTMHLAAHDIPPLIEDEYHALLRHYGQTQARCDVLVRAQAAEIARLQGQAMRLRAAVIVRDTAPGPAGRPAG